MRFLICFWLFLSGCVGPAHDTAESLAPTLPGYHAYNQCEPWARAFKKEMDQRGHAVTLIGYRWTYHGESVNHLIAMWRDTDGWWARDNIRGPVQVDSFDHYDWPTRVDNFVFPMGSIGDMPHGNVRIENVRIVP